MASSVGRIGWCVSQVELHYLSTKEDGFDIDLDQAVDMLDQGELHRYQSFRVEHAKQCFLQARRIAKTQLAEKLGCSAKDVRFDYTETEKPFLIDENSQAINDWHFNISHSHSVIVVAIAKHAVGVDVEDIDRCLKVWMKAGSFLNSFAKTQVDKGRTDQECAAIFAEQWGCTESYVKLKGSAIYRDKDRVQAKAHSNFIAGSKKTFEDVFFTNFNFDKNSRISVAVEKEFPCIELIYWRSGKREVFN
ncbi:MAG: hypothetical protein K6L76_12785 [Agarilytica sp.]